MKKNLLQNHHLELAQVDLSALQNQCLSANDQSHCVWLSLAFSKGILLRCLEALVRVQGEDMGP